MENTILVATQDDTTVIYLLVEAAPPELAVKQDGFWRKVRIVR